MRKKAFSKGSPMAAAFWMMRLKHSSITCGMAGGVYTLFPISTGRRRSLPEASGSAMRFSDNAACKLSSVKRLMSYVRAALDKHLDRNFVIQDHLGLFGRFYVRN